MIQRRNDIDKSCACRESPLRICLRHYSDIPPDERPYFAAQLGFKLSRTFVASALPAARSTARSRTRRHGGRP